MNYDDKRYIPQIRRGVPQPIACVGWDFETRTIRIGFNRPTDKAVFTEQQAADLADAIVRAGLELRGVGIGHKDAGFDYLVGGPFRAE